MVGVNMSERKAKWQNDYIRRNYDRINFLVQKGDKEKIKEHALKKGESMSEFINRAIKEAMISDENK